MRDLLCRVGSRCRNEVKSRRESRDTRHREKFVSIRESISYPFLLMYLDFSCEGQKESVFQ